MSWYESVWQSVSETAGEWYDTASEGVDGILEAKLDKTTERVNTSTENRVNDATAVPTTQAKTSGPGNTSGLNWQVAGVVVGALGVAIGFYKLMK